MVWIPIILDTLSCSRCRECDLRIVNPSLSADVRATDTADLIRSAPHVVHPNRCINLTLTRSRDRPNPTCCADCHSACNHFDCCSSCRCRAVTLFCCHICVFARTFIFIRVFCNRYAQALLPIKIAIPLDIDFCDIPKLCQIYIASRLPPAACCLSSQLSRAVAIILDRMSDEKCIA